MANVYYWLGITTSYAPVRVRRQPDYHESAPFQALQEGISGPLDM